MSESPLIERRRHHRLRLHPMYTSVKALQRDIDQRRGAGELTGHAYDISASGIRIELDEPLNIGQHVELKVALPGTYRDIAAQADVVWVHGSDDDPGPRRMALRFTGFESPIDRMQLARYLEPAFGRLAA